MSQHVPIGAEESDENIKTIVLAETGIQDFPNMKPES
jgi:hypothetical protein